MWKFVLGLGATLLLVLAGCGKSEPKSQDQAGARKFPTPPAAASAAVVANPDAVVHLHWVGMKKLAAGTNASYFLTLWNLAETGKLKNQTLDRLASWLATNELAINSQTSVSTPTNQPAINSPSSTASLLRPLLDDLVQEEFYLEARKPTNQPAELALAVRLPDDRAAVWKTNVASAMGAAADPATSAPGNNHASHLLVSRAGDWTFLGLGPETNLALAGLAASLVQGLPPFPAHTSNSWLEIELNLGRLVDFSSSSNLPTVAVAFSGDGREVVTRGRLYFPKPLELELERWQIPTNLVGAPVSSFTAIRGFRPWLASLDAWKRLQAGSPPNQFFSWSRPGGDVPFLTYCAAPLPEASNAVSAASARLQSDGNVWLASNSVGRVIASTDFNGCRWVGVPYWGPFLRSLDVGGRSFAVTGMMPLPFTNQPPSGELFQAVFAQTNLVYYDWEFSEARVSDWIHIGQLSRVIFGKAQLPGQGAAMSWVAALGPKLGNTLTALTISGPAQLSLARRSSCGLTGVELQLLADWLESPQFPRGLYTFLVPGHPLRPSHLPAKTSAATTGSATNNLATTPAFSPPPPTNAAAEK